MGKDLTQLYCCDCQVTRECKANKTTDSLAKKNLNLLHQNHIVALPKDYIHQCEINLCRPQTKENLASSNVWSLTTVLSDIISRIWTAINGNSGPPSREDAAGNNWFKRSLGLKYLKYSFQQSLSS